MSEGEPQTAKHALKSTKATEWRAAMNEEFKALFQNETWEEVGKTSDMNVIRCRWILKEKKGVDGSVIRHKARLVAKGYTQIFDIDYKETYAPVLKYTSLRLLLALSRRNSTTHVDQLDIATAFLNASVTEKIYYC